MGLSFWQIALVVLVFILLFGRGKIPTLMTDIAQGIKGFKKGIRDDIDESIEDETAASDSSSTTDKASAKAIISEPASGEPLTSKNTITEKAQ